MNSQIQKLIETAKSYVGYLEKETNSNLDDFTANAGDENFTKFGKWYGLNGYAWCAMFVSYVAWKAGIPTTVIPKQKSCTSDGVAFFKRFGRWRPIPYTPQPGDIIYFTKDGGKTAAHVGIVIRVDTSTVYTIEGNTSGGSTLIDNGGGVALKSYPLNYSKIMGYGNPAYTDMVAEHKAIIQQHMKMGDPARWWARIDGDEFAEEFYKKWVESYT